MFSLLQGVLAVVAMFLSGFEVHGVSGQREGYGCVWWWWWWWWWGGIDSITAAVADQCQICDQSKMHFLAVVKFDNTSCPQLSQS